MAVHMVCACSLIVFALGCRRILVGEDLGGRRPGHAGGGLIKFLQLLIKTKGARSLQKKSSSTTFFEDSGWMTTVI